MLPEGHVVAAGANAPTIDYNFAGPGYFEAMGAAVLRGRPFEDRDGEKGREVAVVNEAFTRRFWTGGDAIGKRVGVLGHELAVVGVVEDGKYWSLGEEPRPYLYLPIGIQYRAERVLHVRTAADPASLLGALRQEIRALDPTLPAEVKTMREHLRFTLFPARLLATALTSFSALALLLAAVGVYGVVAFWVNQATREIGLRMALGARPREVLSLVVRRAIPEVAMGLALGLAVALAGAHLAAGLLYGVDPVDPRAYLAAAALLGGVALVATLLPARRASRVDPATALRAE
jgi:predicted permease